MSFSVRRCFLACWCVFLSSFSKSSSSGGSFFLVLAGVGDVGAVVVAGVTLICISLTILITPAF